MQLDTTSSLKVRLPPDRVPLLLRLAGKRLDLGEYTIRLGAPQIHPLKPSPVLYSRVVTIKGYTEPEPFMGAVRRKLVEDTAYINGACATLDVRIGLCTLLRLSGLSGDIAARWTGFGYPKNQSKTNSRALRRKMIMVATP